MFRSALIKLTAFYIGILLLISLIFSLWVYHEASRELSKGLSARAGYSTQLEAERRIGPPPASFIQDRLDEGRGRVIVNLLYFNLIIIGVGGAASFWLARQTLQPIKNIMDAQNQFTADASHELRTPLAAMRTEIEVGLRDSKRTKAETEELLKSNLEEVNRLSRLSEGLLSLARQNEPIEFMKTDLKEVFARLEKQFSVLAQQKKITIDNRVAKSIYVSSDKLELERLFAILIDNAIKYSPEKTTVAINVIRHKNKVIAQVIDHGMGIPDKEKQRIFERFYRSDYSRSSMNTSGHGLGLAIAKKLAQTLRVDIQIKDNSGGGTIFSVSFL